MILTIFTPTYNRSDKLSRVYESLKCQSCNDFEWLIVDDGSTDDTEEVVNCFLQEDIISIKYVKQDNSGKHVAHNTALNYAEGKFFFCVDSDDWIKEEFIDRFVEEISNSECHGFIAYKMDIDGNLLSEVFPDQLKESSLFELSEVYHCNGEFSLIIKTDIAKVYKFPVFKNEKFLGENVIYDKIGEQYKFKLIDQVATVCEYQENGLTNNLNEIMKRNPAGYCLYFMQRIDMQASLRHRIITAGKYNCFCILAGSQKSEYKGKHKKLLFLLKPLGRLFYVYYKKVRGF